MKMSVDVKQLPTGINFSSNFFLMNQSPYVVDLMTAQFLLYANDEIKSYSWIILDDAIKI